jgi:hypothetical protein
MNSENTTSKNRFKLLFVIAGLAFIGVCIALYFKSETLESYQNTETIPVSEYDQLENMLSTFQAIRNADDLWLLKSQPRKALEKYKALEVVDKELQQSINERIQHLKNILKSESDNELTKLNLRTDLGNTRNERDSLQFALDSIQQTSQLSLGILKRKNDSLENDLQSKKRQLQRKETLKVISFQSQNDILVHYIGETKNDKATGGGVGVWADGSMYRGEWKDNRRHDKGEFKWPDGAKYKGDFVMGERTGEGVFHYPTGEKYEGEFKKGLRSGSGVLYDINNNISFEGQWENDKPKR